MASSPPPPIRTSNYGDETEGEGSPLLPRRSASSSGAGMAGGIGGGGGENASTSEAASTEGAGDDVGVYGHHRGSERLTMTTTATDGSGSGQGGGRDASVMRALWASSGYHSDSALPSSSSAVRRREGSREMLDPA